MSSACNMNSKPLCIKGLVFSYFLWCSVMGYYNQDRGTILVLRKALLFCAVSAMLGACVTSVEQLRQANPQGSSFQMELARQYLEFAESEADAYDWFDSAYFARKGLKLTRGEDAPPEDLTLWHMPEDTLISVSQAREYLISALNKDVILNYPEESARAQFMFDCWVEQQEENWQQEDIARCREEFYNALDRIFMLTAADKASITPEVKPEVKPEAKAAKSPNPVQETRLAYFKLGSSTLDDGVKRLVSSFVSRLKDVKQYKITLNGYADMVGGEEFNMKLSKKRAMAVKSALVDAGLDEKSITLFAFGQSGMRVKTAKGVPSKENRVVEVMLEID